MKLTNLWLGNISLLGLMFLTKRTNRLNDMKAIKRTNIFN